MPRAHLHLTRTITMLLLGAGLVLAAAAPARADRGEHHQEVVVKTLPHGYRTVHFGGRDYYEHQGRYFQRQPRGFALVPPPVGALVVSLPVGNIRLTIGGTIFFRQGEVYYRPVRGGYQVVAPPVVAPHPARERVVIEVRRLNVRVGPGANYRVITRLAAGTELAVVGQVPGWYRVVLAGGGFGWVDSRYTGPAAAG